MLDFTRLRLVWEPRMLSLSRLMIGMLIIGCAFRPHFFPYLFSIASKKPSARNPSVRLVSI